MCRVKELHVITTSRGVGESLNRRVGTDNGSRFFTICTSIPYVSISRPKELRATLLAPTLARDFGNQPRHPCE